MAESRTNFIVADDHALIREGIVSLLSKFDRLGNISEAADGKSALDVLLTNSIDIAILDIKLPGLSGLDVAREVRRRKLPTRLVLMTGEISEDAAATAITDLSLNAFLFKTADMRQFKHAIRAVIDGHTFFPANLEKLITTKGNDTSTLSIREKQVIRLIAEGHTSESAANVFGISHHTVRKHRENVRRKLGLSTVAELSAYAHRNQLL